MKTGTGYYRRPKRRKNNAGSYDGWYGCNWIGYLLWGDGMHVSADGSYCAVGDLFDP